MIVARSPLRISIGGGGTDLPSYYEQHGGFLISAAIDKHVYLTLNRSFGEQIILKYSEMEKVNSIAEIKHPIFREALKLLGITESNLEITSIADVPTGTGLGSSGSFTTALLKLLHAHMKNPISPQELAEQACHIEIDLLKRPVGKQDQYIAAFGGLTCLQIGKDGKVTVSPLDIDAETLYNLEDNLVLFFTGYSRSASSILQEQNDKSNANDREMIENLHYIKELGLRIKDALQARKLDRFGVLMNEHWQYKKKRSDSMSNSAIDKCYDLAMRNGAGGGKLVGAGGGGYLLFYAEDKVRLRRAMREEGLDELRFRFEPEGTRIVV